MKMTPSPKHLAVMLFLTVGISASPAAAAETRTIEPDGVAPGTRVDAAPAGRLSWYGYQTFSADATAIALLWMAAEKDSDPAAVGTIGVYLLGAPTVHGVHRRPGAVVGSVALRVFLPFLGSALGAASADCSVQVVNDENCDFGGKIVGFVVGAAAAMVIDSAALAWERKAPPAPERSATRAASFPTGSLSLAPVPIRDGGGLLFSGRF